ncbi:MAG: redoxin domain-containing protein, partial [Actinobacteria bacterium]|nr:redoxin domain-containing protein [Actinomycetota bacterium]
MRQPRFACARLPGAVAVLLLGAALAGCGEAAPRSAAPTAHQVAAAFAGSPPPLAALHAQANQLLSATTAEVKSRLGALRGHPVIVNVWGSWCGPCRTEFPILQQAAVALGRHVAFLGLDAADNPGNARSFL